MFLLRWSRETSYRAASHANLASRNLASLFNHDRDRDRKSKVDGNTRSCSCVPHTAPKQTGSLQGAQKKNRTPLNCVFPLDLAKDNALVAAGSGREAALPSGSLEDFQAQLRISCGESSCLAGGGRELQLQGCVSSGRLGGGLVGTETDVFKLSGGGGVVRGGVGEGQRP